MCGRYVATSSPAVLAEQFKAELVRLEDHDSSSRGSNSRDSRGSNYRGPNYNVTPRSSVPVVAESQGERVLDVVRWGLVPPWAKDLSVGDRMINARAERVRESNAYKRPFAKRRCIVPADGFYEWQVVGDKRPKQPWYFHRRDGRPFAFAGLWETWRDKELGDDAPRVRSCVIITTDANDLVRPVHERMPVVLPEATWDEWLDPDNHDVDHLQELLVPAATDEMEAWRVSTRVNRPGNNGPELLDEFEPEPERSE